MELAKVIGTDGALFLFCAAGLAATVVAIVVDTKTQAAEHLAKRPARVD
ncbi:MAG: hypothetical protein HYX56_00310 [Chloroflexi bacterium]|nr:hypothetical protein [Chloroflexota bacterium]